MAATVAREPGETVAREPGESGVGRFLYNGSEL
jgi:hypothetical protein